MQEFTKMNIPGAYCCPGAELVYRVSDASIDSETMVVVNCAGRTRSIIGCQSLINAGVPNPVVALKDGTMGWHLAGFELGKRQSRYAPKVSKTAYSAQRKYAGMSSNVLEFNRSRFRNSGHFRNNPKNVPFFFWMCVLRKNSNPDI